MSKGPPNRPPKVYWSLMSPEGIWHDSFRVSRSESSTPPVRFVPRDIRRLGLFSTKPAYNDIVHFGTRNSQEKTQLFLLSDYSNSDKPENIRQSGIRKVVNPP